MERPTAIGVSVLAGVVLGLLILMVCGLCLKLCMRKKAKKKARKGREREKKGSEAVRADVHAGARPSGDAIAAKDVSAAPGQNTVRSECSKSVNTVLFCPS